MGQLAGIQVDVFPKGLKYRVLRFSDIYVDKSFDIYDMYLIGGYRNFNWLDFPGATIFIPRRAPQKDV